VTNRYIAFLRGINVGGHTVKKAQLCAPFEAIGCKGLETFIASGNVIFDADQTAAALEDEIELKFEETLGYAVGTFVRTRAEVAAIAEREPFKLPDTGGVYVCFLKKPLSAAAKRALNSLANDVDEFEVVGREVYWLARQGMGRTTVSPSAMANALGGATTNRNMTTIRRLAAKYPP
jgi:uncharacterized protein (DUF1697 family)